MWPPPNWCARCRALDWHRPHPGPFSSKRLRQSRTLRLTCCLVKARGPGAGAPWSSCTAPKALETQQGSPAAKARTLSLPGVPTSRPCARRGTAGPAPSAQQPWPLQLTAGSLRAALSRLSSLGRLTNSHACGAGSLLEGARLLIIYCYLVTVPKVSLHCWRGALMPRARAREPAAQVLRALHAT
jgi:hypothetical protein